MGPQPKPSAGNATATKEDPAKANPPLAPSGRRASRADKADASEDRSRRAGQSQPQPAGSDFKNLINKMNEGDSGPSGSKDPYTIFLIASACLGAIVLLVSCQQISKWERDHYGYYSNYRGDHSCSSKEAEQRSEILYYYCNVRSKLFLSGALGMLVGIAQLLCCILALYLACFKVAIVLIVHVVFALMLLLAGIVSLVAVKELYDGFSYGRQPGSTWNVHFLYGPNYRWIIEDTHGGVTLLDFIFCIVFIILIIIMKILKKC